MQLSEQPIDLVPGTAAIIDARGTILAVSKEWRRFADENGGFDQTYGIGKSYLSACCSAYPDPYAERAIAALDSVLTGARPDDAFYYPCNSPDEKRWFVCRIRPLNDERKQFLIAHYRAHDHHEARHLLDREPPFENPSAIVTPLSADDHHRNRGMM